MKKKWILTALIVMASFLTAKAWFDPDPPYYGKIIITRANTYETYQKDQDVFNEDASIAGVAFFDAGDVDADITLLYGGDPVNTFDCAYPATFYFWFQTNSTLSNYEWAEARFQYHVGTDTGPSTAWTTIATITNFPPSFLGNKTVHFGFFTWTPPTTNNVYYLVRIWGKLKNGMENADLTATSINKDGDGNTWDDNEVLLIRAIPWKKPGARSATKSMALVDIESEDEKIDEKIKPKWYNRLSNWFKNLW